MIMNRRSNMGINVMNGLVTVNRNPGRRVSVSVGGQRG